jgi:hypothetical protein
MRLVHARSLDDYDIDHEEMAGWRERQAGKDRRRRRRADKRQLRRQRDRYPTSPRPAASMRVQQREPELEPAPDLREEGDDEELLDLFEDAMEQLAGLRRRRRGRFGQDGAWSQAVRMSRNLRIQAAKGHRAAVMELRPGLYLVAEMPEDVARSQFGFAPLLAPLMVRSARRAIERPEGRPGLFRRREPRALPGPVVPMLPGPVAPQLPTTEVAWADPADVAGLLDNDDWQRGR